MLTGNRLRIVSALVLSLGIHAGIMNLGTGRLHPVFIPAITPRRVTMTLTARQSKKVDSLVKIVEEKAPPVIEPKTIQKIEKVIVREFPLPVAVPSEKLPVVEQDTANENSASTPVQGEAVQRHDPVKQAVAESKAGDSASERPVDSMIEEKLALLPIIIARPMYKKNPKPIYPSMARRRGFQGTTLLEVLVDSQGRVGDLRVYQSCGHEILDRAAMTAVKDWLFEPGRRGDDKVDMWVRVPVRFQLR